MTLVSTAAKGGGSGSGALTLLSNTVLAVDGTIDVSGISQSYNDLVMVLIARGTRAAAADFLQIRLNNDSTAVYDGGVNGGGLGQASNAISSGGATSARISGNLPGASATSGDFATYEIVIAGYTSSTWQKVINVLGACPVTNGSLLVSESAAGLWRSTAAVNRVAFFGGTTANLLAGSSLRIYGRL